MPTIDMTFFRMLMINVGASLFIAGIGTMFAFYILFVQLPEPLQ